MEIDYKKNHKTFIKAYNLLSKDHRKYKTYYNDKRLTHSEKSILKAYYAFKKGDLNCLEYLKGVTGLNPFLMSYKFVIESSFYNNSGKLKLAISSAKKAITSLESIGNTDFIFTPVSQLVLTYGNLKDQKNMKLYLDRLSVLDQDNDYKKGLYLQCKGFYELICEKPDLTVDSIGECLNNYKTAVKDRLGFMYIVLFMAYVQLDKPDECFAALQEYKKSGGFKVKSNYKYAYTMLNFVYNGSPIYSYKRDFKDVPILYYELEVIKQLSKEDYQQAMIAWTYLHEKNPAVYQLDFKYKGMTCIFSKALEGLDVNLESNEQETSEIDFDHLNNLNSYQAKLEYILLTAKAPIDADDLVAYLWGEQADFDSILKLRTQISRLRSKKKLKIQHKNGSYRLVS